MIDRISRREFLKLSAAGIGAVIGAEFGLGRALAADRPKTLFEVLDEYEKSSENVLNWGAVSDRFKGSVVRFKLFTGEDERTGTATIIDTEKDKKGFIAWMVTTGHGLSESEIKNVNKMVVSSKILPAGITIDNKNLAIAANTNLGSDFGVVVIRGQGGFPFSGIGGEKLGGEPLAGDAYQTVSYPGLLENGKALVQTGRVLADGKIFGLSSTSHISSAERIFGINPFPIMAVQGSSGSPMIVRDRVVALMTDSVPEKQRVGFMVLDKQAQEEINRLLARALAHIRH